MIKNYEVKTREREHFDNLTANPLAFLEKDQTALQKLAIRFLLSRWDGSLKYIPADALEGKTALDACCGNPRIVSWMASRGATAFGCDISIKMLTMGNARGVSYALDRQTPLSPVRWAVADCERLPFADSSFDTITCFQAYHHVNHETFLAECRRVLKPGGRIVISDPNGDHPLRSLATWTGRRMKLLSDDEKSSGRGEVISQLRAAGFEIDQCYSINFFSEIVFLIEELLRPRRPILSAVLRASLLFFYPLDSLLDLTLYKIFPNLAWRNIFLGTKK